MESRSFRSWGDDSSILMLTRSSENTYHRTSEKVATWLIAVPRLPSFRTELARAALNTVPILWIVPESGFIFLCHGQQGGYETTLARFSTNDALSNVRTFLFAMHLSPRRTGLSKSSFDCERKGCPSTSSRAFFVSTRCWTEERLTVPRWIARFDGPLPRAICSGRIKLNNE